MPVFTVAENIDARQRARQGTGCSTSTTPARRIRELGDQYGLPVDPDAKVGDLSVGEQQRVELVKALFRRGRHPDPRRADRGAHAGRGRRLLRRRPQPGRSGQVDHLHHPQAARGARRRRPDHGAARRPGRRHRRPDDGDPAVAGQPDGRPRRRVPGREGDRRSPATSCSTSTSCRSQDDRGVPTVNGFELEVRAGEIFGVAGVEGNGQRELVEAIAGMRRKVGRHASRSLGQRRHQDATPARSPSSGVAHIPEDREQARPRRGVHDRRQPRAQPLLTGSPFARRGIRNVEAIDGEADGSSTEFDVRTPGIDVAGRTRCRAATSRRSSSPAS